jgi:hypothetical protein
MIAPRLSREVEAMPSRVRLTADDLWRAPGGAGVCELVEYRPDRTARLVSEADSLDASDVLPGLELRLDDLFD